MPKRPIRIALLIFAGLLQSCDNSSELVDRDIDIAATGTQPDTENVELDQAPETCPPREISDLMPRMIGGAATKSLFWPGFASLYFLDQDKNSAVMECGGLLLNATTILTAAHCVVDLEEESPGVFVGKRHENLSLIHI